MAQNETGIKCGDAKLMIDFLESASGAVESCQSLFEREARIADRPQVEPGARDHMRDTVFALRGLFDEAKQAAASMRKLLDGLTRAKINI